MGELALPYILQDPADNGPDDWFWALAAITDENPITEEIAGDMTAMTEAWLQWGRKAEDNNGWGGTKGPFGRVGRASMRGPPYVTASRASPRVGCSNEIETGISGTSGETTLHLG
jgi:hypothetical protein